MQKKKDRKEEKSCNEMKKKSTMNLTNWAVAECSASVNTAVSRKQKNGEKNAKARKSTSALGTNLEYTLSRKTVLMPCSHMSQVNNYAEFQVNIC